MLFQTLNAELKFAGANGYSEEEKIELFGLVSWQKSKIQNKGRLEPTLEKKKKSIPKLKEFKSIIKLKDRHTRDGFDWELKKDSLLRLCERKLFQSCK